jgi:hypothetical protein
MAIIHTKRCKTQLFKPSGRNKRRIVRAGESFYTKQGQYANADPKACVLERKTTIRPKNPCFLYMLLLKIVSK